MPTYTIEYTDEEDAAMNFIASSADDWLQHMAHERARIAIDEIVKGEVNRLLEAGLPIPQTKEEIFAGANLTKQVFEPINPERKLQ